MKHYTLLLKIAVFFLMTVGIFSSCGKTISVPDEQVYENVTGTIIGKGSLFSFENSLPEQYTVIKNNSDWENLFSKIRDQDNGLSTFTETNIDFSKFIIIVVIDEVKGSGGWTIDITNITENSRNLVVTVENLHKWNLASVITQPFEIIKIPVTNKKIIFNKKR
jgi:hypothetical protein